MYRVNEMAQGEELCTIQTSFKGLRLYFCLVTGRQASGVYAPPEHLVLRTEKVMYTTSFSRNSRQNLGANWNCSKSIVAEYNGTVTWHVRTT